MVNISLLYRIKAGQQTLSDRDAHLSGNTFALPGILTGHVKKRPEKMHFHTVIFFHPIFFACY